MREHAAPPLLIVLPLLSLLAHTERLLVLPLVVSQLPAQLGQRPLRLPPTAWSVPVVPRPHPLRPIPPATSLHAPEGSAQPRPEAAGTPIRTISLAPTLPLQVMGMPRHRRIRDPRAMRKLAIVVQICWMNRMRRMRAPCRSEGMGRSADVWRPPVVPVALDALPLQQHRELERNHATSPPLRLQEGQYPPAPRR